MAQFGKITHYDAQTGSGMIAPQQGGDLLRFDSSGLQSQAQEPRTDQLYTYETRMDESGAPVAVNLQMEQGANATQQDPHANGNQGGFDQQGQSQNRHNQEAASRPGVDQQSQSQSQDNRDNLDGVSRGGTAPARPDDQSASTGGGSTFQPLEAESSKRDRSPEEQHHLGRTPQGDDERSR